MSDSGPVDMARFSPDTCLGRALPQRTRKVAMACLLGVILLCAYVPSVTFAAEGAASHYLPGAGGDILLAAPPEPGFQAAATLWFQSGSTDLAGLEGRLS